MIRRTISEWSAISYGDGPHQILPYAASRIAAVAAASSHAGEGGAGILEHGRKELRAKGVVGVIAADGCALEILPKIDISGNVGGEGQIRQRLVHMLTVVLELKVDVGQLTALDWQRETVLEILIRLFSEKLSKAIRQGMPRRYLEHNDDLPVLRGRLNVSRQFTKNAVNFSVLSCQYDGLTRDIALNQILKKTVTFLAGVAQTDDNRRRLRELAFAYAEISDVPLSELRWDSVVLDRSNNRWKELLNFARLLLHRQFQTTSAGGGNGFALLFQMSALFEAYTSRMLKRAVADTDLHIISQGGRRFCLEAADGRGVFQTKPDILVKRENVIERIIDTKWKRISAHVDDPKQGVSQGDIYQMMAYGQLYNCNRLTLLYPHHLGLNKNEGVHSVHRIAGSGRWLETATFDISRAESVGERLRAFAMTVSE